MRGLQLYSTILILILQSFVFGQGGPEITIQTIGDRSVEPAHRRTTQPQVVDTVFPTPSTQYPLLSINYEPSFEISKIEPAKVNLTPKLPQLYNGYARLGIGSILMPLAEVYYNNGRSRRLNYGIHAKHHSSMGKMRDVGPANYDLTNLRAFAGINERKYSWNVGGFYQTQGLHYYGYPNLNAPKDSIKQRFNTFGLNGGFDSHEHDSLGFNWRVNLEYHHLNDLKPKADSISDWHARENFIGIRSGIDYKWGKEIYAVDFDVLYNGYKYGKEFDTLYHASDSGVVINNTVIRLKPSISTYSKDQRLKAKIGVDLTASLGSKSKVYIYPNAEVKYSLFNDILIPYAGVSGGLTQMTFQTLTNENPFVMSGVNLQNEHKAIDGYAGIKGTLSKRIGFNASISFAHYKNKALFVNDTLLSNSTRFKVIYDTMNITTIEGSIYYQLKEKVKLDLIGRYYSYNARNNIYAWNLPQLQIILRGNYNLYDKFILTADINLMGGRRAQVFAPGNDVYEENNQYAVKLGFIADANIGVEYRYNKRISAFLNFNNVAAQRYKRWYNYPTQGFQVMGGVTFRF